MLRIIYIYLLLSIVIILNCAPVRHIARTDIRGISSEADESYSWTETYDDFGYEADQDSDYYRNHSDNGESNGQFRDINTGGNNKKSSLKEKNQKYKGNKSTRSHKKNEVKASRPQRIKSTAKIKYYKVKRGDNLTKISRKFKVSVKAICKKNRIKKRNKIKIGQLLKIPVNNRVIQKIVRARNAGKIKNIPKVKPKFNWPIKKIKTVKRDGQDGVKSIGIIITGKENSRILSSACGIVKKIGIMRGFGQYVIMKHMERYFTIYSNLQTIFVREGQEIGSGKTIGKLNGNKLHFQIDYSGKPEDPLKYLSKRS